MRTVPCIERGARQQKRTVKCDGGPIGRRASYRMTRGQRWSLAASAVVGMCANCHIMSEHYAAWIKASHHAVATCNDCHTPHNIVGKYTVKARNGFWHSFYFTTGSFPDPLRITERNREVTEHACRYCHAEITEAIDHSTADVSVRSESAVRSRHADEPMSCVRCHRYVGHWVR